MSLKTIIKFGAPWCGPCRMFAPIFKEMSIKYSQFEFKEINCDDDTESVNKYKISAIPQVLFLDKNGNEISRLTAPLDKAKVSSEIMKYL